MANQLINLSKSILDDILKNCTSRLSIVDIDIDQLTETILKSIPTTITQSQLYNFIADTCIVKSSYSRSYSKLASTFLIDKLHMSTESDILIVATECHEHQLISEELFDIIYKNSKIINEWIDMSRDYYLDYFGVKTLERSYLLKIKTTNKILERPQHMWMRIALGIHKNDLDSALETYNYMSKKYFTHSSPTLFNSGTNRPQLSSCFLLGMDDNMENILDTIKKIGLISKWSGGIGVHLSDIRANGSLIKGTNGLSEGIIPLCILLNKLGKYVNQGGKRNGSIACYLEPWHADIIAFCELKLNTGNDDNRARDLFLALWIPDLFMERVKNNEIWSIMCPNECPNLTETYGDDFNKLYLQYEKDGKYKKQLLARDIWMHIMKSQIETGMPYICFKDHANKKSNQINLGTIKSSNLCSEIIQHSTSSSVAVCNLSSICLPNFIVDNKFDFDELGKVTRICVRNLNKIIDINYYPVEEAKINNFDNRPIGIGVQGLADVYNKMGYPFDSDNACELNKRIFETIYYHAWHESNKLSKTTGLVYKNFIGSPISKGLFQFNLWNLEDTSNFDWQSLRQDIIKYGVANSLITCVMPTATTSQIMGNSEMIDPYLLNIYTRTTLAGEFIVINYNLMDDLNNLGLWSEDMRKKIILNNGSIQNISNIPDYIKEIYKTAFEIKLKPIIRQSSDRGPWIDQSQSLNLYMETVNFDILTSAAFYAHASGLKTGSYYIRTLPAANPINFGIDIKEIVRLKNENTNDTKQYEKMICKIKNGERDCVMCSA